MLLKSARVNSLACFGAALLLLEGGVLGGVCSAATILGDAIPLSSLANNAQGVVDVGDKRFTDFTYHATGDMPVVANVNVIPIQDDLGKFGLRFQGAFVDVPSSPNGSTALITYNVEATDPLKLISDAHMQGNPALLGEFGSISVVDTFLPLGKNGEYTMAIFDDESLPTPRLADAVFFTPPVRRLSVQKDILAIATQNSQTATLSFVDQTYSQIIIPEPASVLLALACFGLIGLGRRRVR